MKVPFDYTNRRKEIWQYMLSDLGEQGMSEI